MLSIPSHEGPCDGKAGCCMFLSLVDNSQHHGERGAPEITSQITPLRVTTTKKERTRRPAPATTSHQLTRPSPTSHCNTSAPVSTRRYGSHLACTSRPGSALLKPSCLLRLRTLDNRHDRVLHRKILHRKPGNFINVNTIIREEKKGQRHKTFQRVS